MYSVGLVCALLSGVLNVKNFLTYDISPSMFTDVPFRVFLLNLLFLSPQNTQDKKTKAAEIS